MKTKLLPNAFEPERAHPQDAGLDLRAPAGAIVYPGKKRRIDTGVCVELPPNTCAYVKNRSSMFSKGLMVDGTIDVGYTGEIGVVLWNISNEPAIIKRGDKIAQLVIHPIVLPDIELVQSLDTTERGSGGFGSTGR